VFGLRKRRQVPTAAGAAAAAQRIRDQYASFQEILSGNTECLELIAGLQEDLQYIPARRDVIQDRVTAVFERTRRIVAALGRMTGRREEQLLSALGTQRNAVERHVAAEQELITPRLAVSLTEVKIDDVPEVGGKAAYLGELGNRLGVPVPNGFVLTTEAYRQFCGIPKWEEIRNAIRDIDAGDMEKLHSVSARLQELVLAQPLPRAVEVALVDRARRLRTRGPGFAIRSSAVGEGGAQTFAGQFLSMLNVPAADVVSAYKQVIAARFSERALSYRLSSALSEVDSPMAVLVLPLLPARASGILYTRDPSNPKSKELWITSTWGLGVDIASGKIPADLFVVSRKRGHRLIESQITEKTEQVVPAKEGGITHRALDRNRSLAPSLDESQIAALAAIGVAIEKHLGSPQDIEWTVDEDGAIWILQARPLALVEAARGRSKGKPHGDPILSGGRTVFPGRVSGKAFLVDDLASLRQTPAGSILFLKNASPEVVPAIPRISGLVAEWGNVAGHAAALLREFKVPSVFLMKGAFEQVEPGSAVSLDAVARHLYAGKWWDARELESPELDYDPGPLRDPIHENILALNMVDPSSAGFRPSACKSTHDVLRYCHEKAVEAMFTANDVEMEVAGAVAREIQTDVPLNLHVLDLGDGIVSIEHGAKRVTPAQIACRPFQSFWRGISSPGVSWRRDMGAGFSDLADLVASSFTPRSYDMRELGMKSYVLVGDVYMNLNARLAYHFTLIDACLCDDPIRNYVSFRFAGGGATRGRRNLRACFLEACLLHYGFLVHRRGDLVNAWLRRLPAEETDWALDIMGRLMASSAQLDMYMSNRETMNWFVEQFLAGNYSFKS